MDSKAKNRYDFDPWLYRNRQLDDNGTVDFNSARTPAWNEMNWCENVKPAEQILTNAAPR